jgi:hypothetical protein
MPSRRQSMAQATQFCVGLDNQPGMLAKLCEHLKQAGVNIEALFVSDDENCSWVNFIAAKTCDPERALSDGGYRFFTEKVLTVRMDNRPGALQDVAAQLAEAGVNIDYVYGSAGAEPSFMLVVQVDDLTRAEKALKG